MRVLVAGGGISGTVTAMALKLAGHEPVVYEAYPAGGDDSGASSSPRPGKPWGGANSTPKASTGRAP